MHRVYLVSQGAQTGGSRLMGLGTFYPPRVLVGTNCQCMTCNFRRVAVLATAPQVALRDKS